MSCFSQLTEFEDGMVPGQRIVNEQLAMINSYRNAQILSGAENRAKSNKQGKCQWIRANYI